MGLEVEAFSSVMNSRCFIRSTSFSELADEFELDSGSDLSRKGTLVLAHPPYSARSALAQASFAHDVFSKKETKRAVRLKKFGILLVLGRTGIYSVWR